MVGTRFCTFSLANFSTLLRKRMTYSAILLYRLLKTKENNPYWRHTTTETVSVETSDIGLRKRRSFILEQAVSMAFLIMRPLWFRLESKSLFDSSRHAGGSLWTVLSMNCLCTIYELSMNYERANPTFLLRVESVRQHRNICLGWMSSFSFTTWHWRTSAWKCLIICTIV